MEPPRAAQAICVEVIEDAGYRVVAWDGHDDVVAFLSRTGADLVIQDIRLGTTHSIWSLLERVNAQPPPAPRVVLCSADRVFLHTNRLALEARSCAIVEKPFDVETLLETVAACLAS